jgi:hypothetical protein
VMHFPKVNLLICLFHIWQAWQNALNKNLQAVPKGKDRQHVRKRLATFALWLLKDISEYNEAITTHKAEVVYWSLIKRKQAKILKAQAASALNFLAYLNNYLKEKALWLQWLRAGVLHAAECIGVSIDSIAQTNNHLEPHNGHIKGNYFEPFTHGGQLPHLDHWVQTLVILVIPKFFAKLADKHKLCNYWSAMHCTVPAMSSLAEHNYEIELLSANVLADADTKETQYELESSSDSKSLEHSTTCDSTGSEEARHEATLALVLHVSDSEIGLLEDMTLEDSINEFNQDNALDEDEIVVQLCQPCQAVLPSLLNEHALITQEVLSLEDELVALLKRASSINMDLTDIKNKFFANVNRHVNEPKAHSSASESNCCISVLPPVKINHAPVDSTEIT